MKGIKLNKTELNEEISSQLFKTIFYDSPIAIELYDANGKLIEVNKTCVDLFGVLDQLELKGFELFKDPNIPIEEITKLKRGKTIRYESDFDFEKVKDYKLYKTSKSGTINLDILITPLSLESKGLINNYLVQIQDITKQTQTESVLRKLNEDLEQRIRERTQDLVKSEEEIKLNEERLKSLLKLSELQNLSRKEYVAYSLEECVRLTKSEVGYFDFFSEDQKNIHIYAFSKNAVGKCKLEKNLHYPLENNGIWADCVRLRKPVIHNDYPNAPNKKGMPEGHFPVKRHMSVPVFDGEKIVAIIGVGNKEEPYNETDVKQLMIFMDNTWRILKQKQSEIRLKYSQSKYRRAYKQVNFYKDLFSHEIGNIVQAISGLSESYKYCNSNYDSTTKIDDLIERIQKNTNNAIELINKVRKLSQLEEIKTISLEDVDVSETLHDALNYVRNKFKDKKIEVRVEIEIESKIIRANEMLIDVFENIFTNAVKFNNNSKIEITVKISKIIINEKKWIMIQFIDNGIGIQDSQKKIIFKKKFKDLKEGKVTGFGLTLVKKIIERYRGKIWVENRIKDDYTKGTKFVILLPVLN